MFWPANNTGHSKGPAPNGAGPLVFPVLPRPMQRHGRGRVCPAKPFLGTKRPVPRTENAADSFFRHAVSAAFGGREAFFCACLRFQLVSGVPLSLAM